MIFIGCLMIVVGIIVLFLIGLPALADDELAIFLFSLLISAVLVFGGINVLRTDIQHTKEINQQAFTQAVQTQTYETERTFIIGVYKDKIDTEDGEFYTSENGVKTLEGYKLDDIVKIYYIEDKNVQKNYIMKIEKIEGGNK